MHHIQYWNAYRIHIWEVEIAYMIIIVIELENEMNTQDYIF